MKTLTLLSILIWTSAIAADPLYYILPAQNSSLDENACQLRIHNGIHFPPYDSMQCSGTMINSHTFVTAAHCFLFNPPELFNFYVRCPNGIQVAAKAIFVHPLFYMDSTTNARGELDTPWLRFNRSEYDMAVVMTNELKSIKPVSLAEDDDELARLVSRGDCHSQGYSPFRCHAAKKECENKASPQNITENFLNYLSNEKSIGHGDSGSGVFCRDEKGKEKLVGINISSDPNKGVLQAKNFRDFLKQIERREYPSVLPFAPEALEAYSHLYRYNIRLAENGFGPSIQMEDYKLPISKYGPVLKILDEASADPNFPLLMALRSIEQIQIYEHSSNQIELHCVLDKRPCWINTTTTLKKEELTQFLRGLQ